MPYPKTPFSDEFDGSLIYEIESESSHSSSKNISNFTEIFKWLCTPPRVTSIRVNTIKCSTENILDLIKSSFKSISEYPTISDIYIHECMKDVIIIKHFPRTLEIIYPKEVIVDAECGSAILRGAHIFAPGVLGMLSGCQKGDKVSVYVDLAKKCRKGLSKYYDEKKFFIGNGIVRMPRSALYGENLNLRGIAVEMTETISGCPRISESLFEDGTALLQNLPSIICIYSLDPHPDEIILDMCAAPGHKTSHIASLMRNQGTLIAIDKTSGKIKKLADHCSNFNVQAHIFLGDSTNIFEKSSERKPEDGPPFPAESFDRILLDAPCSALGKRPQLRNDISNKVLLSYVPLQKKLLKTAVSILKTNGTLVYSTCTITLAENEGIVAWALRKFSNLRLVKSKLHMGSPGLQGTSLGTNELQLLQRFGPNSKTDSIGFFIACFVKE